MYLRHSCLLQVCMCVYLCVIVHVLGRKVFSLCCTYLYLNYYFLVLTILHRYFRSMSKAMALARCQVVAT